MDLSRIWPLAAVLCLTWLLLKAIQLGRRRQELLKALRSFPGPTTHWLYGNIHELTSLSEIFKKLQTWSGIYPFAFPFWHGNFTACSIITHPDYAKTLFARTDPKDNIIYGSMIPWIGKGLLVINGPKWVQHRKLLTPGFHFTILKPNNPYIQAVLELCSLLFARFNSILGLSDLTYWFSPQGYRFRKACQVAHHHTDEITKERKKHLKDEAELQKIQTKRHLDFLDILLFAKDDKGNPLSDEDLRAEVDTFMFGGHDTTASAISWLLYCMAPNPEHQERCREEIKTVMGDHNTIQWDDLSKMTYCTMCIKESLRLYPPVPEVSRQFSKPVTFFDGRSLPEGAWVVISIYLIHKNPSIWSDPEAYDPLRFSPENITSRNSHAFLPFSAGSRNCIGQQFALNELKVALAMTLLRFRLSPDPTNPPPVPIPQVVLRSENGIHLRLEKVV